VARQLGVNRHTARLCRQRFREQGLAGLEDAPGRGRNLFLWQPENLEAAPVIVNK
jgi:transposase